MSKLLQLSIILLSVGLHSSYAFDLEDYASTSRATRDALKKANKNLRLAESALINFIKSNPKLPTRISTISKIGTEIGCCCYEKNCSVVNTKANQLALFDKTVKNDKKLRAVELGITEGQYRFDFINRLREDIVSYHDGMNSQIHTDQQTLLTDQPSTALFDEDIYWGVVNQGYQDPFGPDSTVKMSQYRSLRDVYLQSLREVKDSKGPYLAAKAAYAEAFRTYYNYTGCSNPLNASLSFDEFLSNGGY